MLFHRHSIVATMLCVWALGASANTFYLVRHAEKQPGGADPALTECGQARAQALAAYLAEVKLDAVYATGYQRTQQTAAAVAQSQQLKVSLYDPRDTEALLQQLTGHSRPVLIVGHSNTIPPLVTELSAIAMVPLDEQDYSMLYRVDNSAQSTAVTILRQAFSCDKTE